MPVCLDIYLLNTHDDSLCTYRVPNNVVGVAVLRVTERPALIDNLTMEFNGEANISHTKRTDGRTVTYSVSEILARRLQILRAGWCVLY